MHLKKRRKEKDMKTKKVLKRVLLGVVIAILAIALIATTVVFWYFPRYKSEAKPFDITTQTKADSEITVMSTNVRCWSPTDFGQKSWFYRANLFINNIAEVAPDIIGFQEATRYQYGYLVENLQGYDNVIEYRDNSIFSEGCPIFYRMDIYKLVDKGSFWLSETPTEMSKSWGAAHYRICSYVILEDKNTGQQFVVFNTHLDHVSEEARIKGIGVVLDHIKKFGDIPALLMGDLNAKEDSKTYNMATENFLDAKYETENTSDAITFQGFGEAKGSRIDYIMISKNAFTVDEYQVVDKVYDGVPASDHNPIYVKLHLNKAN